MSGEYHPNQKAILTELEYALQLCRELSATTNLVSLDAGLRSNGAIGISNDWQSLGTVVRPKEDEKGEAEKIIVYVGSSDKNTKVQLSFLQTYGQPGSFMKTSQTVTPGRYEIEIPQIITADVEKGGAVMARVLGGSTDADVQIRVIGGTEIPHLNVNNMLNDSAQETEVKAKIETYIGELGEYVSALPSQYPTTVTAEDRMNNTYTYEPTTSVLNGTDIEGERFTLTLPATEIYRGITSGLEGNLSAQIERVYEALLAWEQEILIGYAKKGVIEEPKDFNNNGTIDADETAHYNIHKAPTARVNVKYQRMMEGAAGYASAHHIGIGYGGTAGYMQGVPFKFDSANNVTNPDTAKLYGDLMGHEYGHVIDTPGRIYAEMSNNMLPSLMNTMLNQDNTSYTSKAMPDLYSKVTSQTLGLSTNRAVVMGMFWQLHLAYEDEDTYMMLINNFDNDLSNDSYFAQMNQVYRTLTAEEKADADKDQLLVRAASKTVGKDLSAFFLAHGIKPNATTLQYVSQFEKEDRQIQYMNDEARRRQLAGTDTMAAGVTAQATFGDGIENNSYVNSHSVPLNLSVSSDADNVLGYEIYRNGVPVNFIVRDKTTDITKYVDNTSSFNNRVATYEVVAYDYALNPTEKVTVGTVKVRHDGSIATDSANVTSNTIDVIKENNDIHGVVPNPRLENILDNDATTIYEGTMPGEEDSSAHGEEHSNEDAHVLIDLSSIKTLVGLEYTAPVKDGALLANALSQYKIEISKDGQTFTTVHEGTFEVTAENPSQMIYFNAADVAENSQLNSYSVRYVKISAPNVSEFSIADLSLVAPPGDNIEIGVSEDNITYTNGLGILSKEFVYVKDDAATPEDETQSIPEGSVVITGEYRGNPAFNVPLVLNQNEEHIADNYNGILLADIPENAPLDEVAEGTWIYWIDPLDATTFLGDNDFIFAELYRTDSADLSDGGQRLVSDTFKLDVPDVLPNISFESEPTSSVISLDENDMDVK